MGWQQYISLDASSCYPVFLIRDSGVTVAEVHALIDSGHSALYVLNRYPTLTAVDLPIIEEFIKQAQVFHGTFDEWVRLVFDHPVTEPPWHWDLSAPRTEPLSPAAALDFLTRLFFEADGILEAYSDAQVDQGLKYLVSNSRSDHAFVISEPGLPIAARKKCLRAMVTVYERVFAKRCTPYLSHFDERGCGELNGVCYMWWDLLPIGGRPESPDAADLHREVLDVLERQLAIEHDACQEAALHGLGHWQLNYPDQVQTIIDRYLQRSGSQIRKELREYATSARQGMVL